MNTPACYEKVNERIIKAFSVEPSKWKGENCWDIAMYDRSGFDFYHIQSGEMTFEQAIEYARRETSKF